jgi:hypothetical protein
MNMTGRRSAIAALALAVITAAAHARDLAIAQPALDSEIVLKACDRFAGAVCSITFRGREHIDRKDHGRLLQSASFFDRYAECYNPTEGGSQRDRRRSSSVLAAASVEGNRLWTLTHMAHWLKPLEDYPPGCGRVRSDVKRSVNTEVLSGHFLEKRITVGLPDFPNVIEHRVTYHVPKAYGFGIFEASTGYMPREFSLALFFDPATGRESDPGAQRGGQTLPVILATPDRRHAMGVYSPELPRDGFGYARYVFPDVMKWNCVFRENNVEPGAYRYRCYVALGTVDEVKETIARLHRLRREP